MTRLTTLSFIRRASILVGVCVWLLPGITEAQRYYDPGLLRKTIDRKPVEFQPVGLRLGGFVLDSGIELAFENSNNIFYLNQAEIGDSVIHVRPWFNLSSDWSRHELKFSFFADLGRFGEFDKQDYKDWTARLDGRIDVKRGSHLNYKVFGMHLHEDRSSPDDVDSVRPTEFSYRGIDVGYSHTFNRLTTALNYDRADSDYKNNVSLPGSIIDNQDRDRTRDELMLRLDYELAGYRRVFLSASGNNVDYDQRVNNDGFERSSHGYNTRLGASWNITGVIVGDLYLEYIDQQYDDPRFTSIDGFGLGASLVWTPSQITNISMLARNGPQETTQIGSSGYFSSLYSIRLQHELRRNLLFNARTSITDNDYGISDASATLLTNTRVTRAGLGLSYLFNRNFYISGGYLYEKQNANVSGFNYRTNRWFVTLGAEL